MTRTVDYYLSKGFDRKTAEYFAGGKKRITGVIPNNDFTLTISFDNGEKRLYDVRRCSKRARYLNRLPILRTFAGSM